MSPLDNLARVQPRSLARLSRDLVGLLEARLWLQVMVALALGCGVGILLGPAVGWVPPPAARTLTSWLALPGQLFLAIVQMVVVPLVFASIIRGLAASEDVEQLRRMGLRTVVYFILTTTVAITLGVSLALVLQPGATIDGPSALGALGGQAPVDVADAPARPSVPEAILGLIPTNPLGAMVNLEMFQVVMFAAIVGVAIVSLAPAQSRPVLELLGSVQDVSMTIVKWAMRLVPVAVFGLIARLIAQVGLDALLGMAAYVGTVLLGLALLLVAYLILVAAVARRSPLRFLTAARDVQLLAFSTSSSAAVMPLSIRTAEEKLGVRPSVAQFLIPIGATINMDGTALYQGVAAVFLAQVFAVDLTALELVLLVVTAVAASIGSPATPGVGIVILSMVVTSVGIPAAGIALLIGVDRILDMSRTALNVTGDLTACVVLDRLLPGPPVEEARRAEEQRERQRDASGQDVLVVEG
ncbi:MAG: dicarboxylate/amino acid:cation symporter [Sandaracinaceae bacterium]